MAWKGNIDNPVPNNIQLGNNMSDIKNSENRALNIRRDDDVNKDFTVNLIDIDTAIFNYIDKDINIHVIDNGNNIKVPIHYASPEKWKSIQQDGVLRDQQGKIQLPVMVFKRGSFSKDSNLMTLNRHLTYPVLKKFDEKNKYDKFSLLNNYVAPTHQIFGVTLPDHIDVTYEFNCWCEYIEQLNKIIQKINFACEEYWGDPKRFKFRVYANDYNFTTENSSDADRLVRSSFSLKVKAYLLEESFENRQNTVKRSLTPKAIKIGTEIVSGEQMNQINNDLKKTSYKKPTNYHYMNPVVPDDETFRTPKINVDGSTIDTSDRDLIAIRSYYDNLIQSTISTGGASGDELVKYRDIWKTAPTSSSDPGQEGWMAYDGNFHYIYVGGMWRRQPLSNFVGF